MFKGSITTFGAVLSCALAASGAHAANVTPDVIFGSGNANGDFTVASNSYAIANTPVNEFPVLELGLRGKLRFNASNQPENTFNYDGTDTYTFQAGTPPTGFGFDPNSPTTPVWSFDWSINSDSQFDGLPFAGLTSLNGLTYELRLDGDPTAGTSFEIFDPINVPFADHGIGLNDTGNGAGTVANDAAEYQQLINDNMVGQNSWNYEFFNEASDNVFLPGLSLFDPNLNGTYRIELAGYFEGNLVAETGINIVVENGTDLNAVPLPASLPLLIGAFGGLAIWRRRRSAA